ncbi:hypothetical protein K438DRAFT_2099566 [Mycena galopus ATCC 62051]|nr:hypothetical protein K438DRAFT_2099566 [Mycena galopus ATCC 62051]
MYLSSDSGSKNVELHPKDCLLTLVAGWIPARNTEICCSSLYAETRGADNNLDDSAFLGSLRNPYTPPPPARHLLRGPDGRFIARRPSLSDSTTTAAAASPTAFPTPVVPKPVVLAPAIVQHVQLPRNRIPLIDDEDMPEQPMFHGDGRPKENAHDYKKNLMLKFVGKGLSDAEKIEALGLGMASGSPADGWFDEPAQKAHTTWAAMSVAFDTKWPKRAALRRVGQDAIEDLLAEKLEAGDIGKRVLHGGGEEFRHVVWVRKMVCIADEIPDPQGLFIGVVRKKLPMIMQDLLGPSTVFADWAALEVAVVAIKRAAIVNAQAKEARLVEMAAVRNVRHVPTPQLPGAVAQQCFQQPRPVQYPQFLPPPPTTLPTPPQLAQGIAPRPFRPDSERLIDLERDTLVQHPNTDTGRSLYQQQVRDWNAQHQNRQPNELRPYPLTPGTAPLDSRGECFNCALLGHMTDGCPNPSMPPLEKKWRQIIKAFFAENYEVEVPVLRLSTDSRLTTEVT